MANIFSKWFKKKEKDEQTVENDLNNKIEEQVPVQDGCCEMISNQDTQPNETGIIEPEAVVETCEEDTLNNQLEINVEEEPKEKPQNLFTKLKEGLAKTRNGIKEKVNGVLANFRKIDEELFEELEEILIMSDMGVETTQKIIESIKKKVKLRNIINPQDIKDLLKEEISELLGDDNSKLDMLGTPSVITIVGVNGVGKTTSIGKIAHKLKISGKRVIIAAGDTFRAAAIDQLEVWGKRAGVDIVKHQEGADPGAVVYDAIQSAKAKNADILICDTAGRLHNKKNLMNELGKVERIIQRELPDSSKEVLLVLDATTGQNAVQQARIFNETTKLTGIILTKLDGTAKGGIIVSIKSELNIPVKFIGVGEGMNDLQEFSPKDFVDALFEE